MFQGAVPHPEKIPDTVTPKLGRLTLHGLSPMHGLG
jgi:hypothetical protein